MYQSLAIELFRNNSQEQKNRLRVEQVFEIFEEILAIQGLDFQKGGQFYEEMISFCIECLENKQGDEQLVKRKVYSLYKRWVTFPGQDLDKAWEEFQKKAEQLALTQSKEAVEQRYKECRKQVKNFKLRHQEFTRALDKYESNLSKDKGLLAFFKQKLKEIHRGNANYIKLYFERALAINPLNNDIWAYYILETEKVVKGYKGVKQEIYHKAIKALPDESSRWIALMLHQEKEGATQEVIADYFQVANGCCGGPEHAYHLMRHFCLYFARQGEDCYEDMKENFDQALQTLREYPQYAVKIAKLAAKVEIELRSSKESTPERVKDKMEYIVRSKEGNLPENWMLYASMVGRLGKQKEARKILQRGLHYCPAHPEKQQIASKLLELEEMHGTAADALKALGLMQETQEVLKQIEETKQEEGQRRKAPKVKPAENIQELKKEKHTLYVRNLPENFNQEQLEALFSELGPKPGNVRIVRNKLGVSRGFAYVDFESKQEAEEGRNLDRVEINGKSLSVQFSLPPSKGNKDNKTVFVNNLSFKLTQEQLRVLFEEYGQVDEVRMIKDDQGRPKGYGYIEFSSESEAQKSAEELNGQRIAGRVLNVVMANSQRSVSDGGESTVHVSNIPFEASEKELEDILGNFGVIKNLVLPRNETGVLKGFAFVEYAEVEDAKKAVRLKSIRMGNRAMVLKKSTRKITKRQPREEGNKTGIQDGDGFAVPMPVKKRRVGDLQGGEGRGESGNGSKKGGASGSNDDFKQKLFR